MFIIGKKIDFFVFFNVEFCFVFYKVLNNLIKFNKIKVYFFLGVFVWFIVCLKKICFLLLFCGFIWFFMEKLEKDKIIWCVFKIKKILFK